MNEVTIKNEEFVWIKDPVADMFDSIAEPSGYCGENCSWNCGWVGCWGYCKPQW